MDFTKELSKRIDEILYYQWDPIGVSEEPFARDEYTGYVGSILSIVLRTDEINDISKLLDEIQENRMGLKPTPISLAHSKKIANLLIQHKNAIQEMQR
jgi:hypothetical protein